MIRKSSEDVLWGQIVARAWCDGAFKQRLLSDPRTVLADHGLEVPVGTEVQVAEGDEVKAEVDDMVCRFTLTVSPPEELTDEDLIGGPKAQCWCGACAACGACGRCACRCACRCF
jgi:hypothetical protein